MAGSFLAPILIPIGAMVPLVFWIFIVFYADSHPVHGKRVPRLDPDEYDTGLQGPYLTKPELRLPRQGRRRLDEAAVPGQRQAEQRQAEERQAEQRQAEQREAQRR
jgi:hypothetical protein